MLGRISKNLGKAKHNYICALVCLCLGMNNLSSVVFIFALLLMLIAYVSKKFIKSSLWSNIAGIIALIYIAKTFGTIFSIEAALSLLSLLQACKLLGLFLERDYVSHFFILIFVLCTQVLFQQNLFAVMGAIASFLYILYGLFRYRHPDLDLGKVFQFQGFGNLLKIILVAVFFVALFLLFPRFQIPLKNLGKTVATIGFSAESKPGEQSEVTLDDGKAFRVSFEGGIPFVTQEMYWVGATLYKTNGYHWKISNVSTVKMGNRKSIGKKINYTLISDMVKNEYLMHLSYPVVPGRLNSAVQEIAPFTYKLDDPSAKRVRYTAISASKIEPEALSETERNLALELPEMMKEGRVKSLALSLKGKNTRETLSNILNHFDKENFVYTLKPGRTQNLADFLLESKKGFCSHYASAFSILARILEIPSRVVVGFQGGMLNRFDGTYTVYQKDAHAWSEAYIEGVGWKRFDAVSVVSPDRIDLGGSQFFLLSPSGEESFTKQERENVYSNRWLKAQMWFESLDNKWTQFMYTYNKDYQKQILNKLKLKWSDLGLSFAVLLSLFIFVFYILNVLRNRTNESPQLIEYKKVLKKLEKYKIKKEPHEGPLSLIKKIEASGEDFNKKIFIEKISSYNKAVYGE